MTEAHFLTTIFKPQNFKADELQLVLEQFEPVFFKKNDFLIEEHKRASYYYYLESGFLRSFSVDLNGNDVTTKFFSQKDIIIDWRSYFLKESCKESIQALTKGKAWKITFSRFMKLFHIEAFREVGRSRLVQNYFELKNHSVSLIADQAIDRYKNLIREKPDVVQNVPLKHIATYLGITDTSLSRIRKELSA
ncbi:MAG: Crp/Fnr family transcriptional regulator [Bacteroidota bacterium]